MANEAVLVDKFSEPINMVCENTAGMEKGTVLGLSDSRFVSASSGAAVFGGILAREKIASDGRTSVAVYRDGIFRMRAGGGSAIVAGELVSISGANIIEGVNAEAQMVAGNTFGRALQTVALGTAETIEVLVGVQ